MSYPIQPVVKPQPSVIIDTINIRVSDINLGESATIFVKCYYGDLFITSQILELKQPDYSEWGTDDNWLVNWVFRQLGFSHPTV